ncbi:MAG: hypothetical protein M1479_03900 [Actinobacteria bacterium]|nr:hypothetical protein [Cyanobacteriota bacterium]MCL5771402.1 hypothetical protein [Actinomycetota bacterium]
MSLENYKNKRNFNKTPEPLVQDTKESESKELKSEISEPISLKSNDLNNPKGLDFNSQKLSFVVHKHFASHLHFDLRLELDGVLKSWALPKGPTINPQQKKLAVMVEDHPLEYINFEGIIPDGNYGAGQVYIWDNGFFLRLMLLLLKIIQIF